MSKDLLIKKLEVFQQPFIEADDIVASSACQGCIAIVRKRQAEQSTPEPYTTFDSLGEEAKVAYRKGYERGLADAAGEPAAVSLGQIAHKVQKHAQEVGDDSPVDYGDAEGLTRLVLDEAGVVYGY